MQHDPGPWRQGKSSDSIVCGSPDSTIKAEGISCLELKRQSVERQAYGGKVICESVRPQNRSLIMAAPDLLAALKLILESEQNQSAINWHIARQAIAKAEGKE